MSQAQFVPKSNLLLIGIGSNPINSRKLLTTLRHDDLTQR